MKILLNVVIACLILVSCYGCGRGKRANSSNSSTIEDDEIEISDEVEIADSFMPDELPDNMPKIKTADIKVSLPLDRIDITSDYGTREDPITGKTTKHNGLDLSASGEYPSALINGVVETAARSSSAGNFVVIAHGDITVTYCHLSKIFVKKGQSVVAGQAIGLTGSTGRSTGEHLHLACKFKGEPFNPEILLSFLQSAISTSEAL